MCALVVAQARENLWMSFEWMRGARGRVAAILLEEAAQTSKQPRKNFQPCGRASTARRAPLVHPLHHGDGDGAQQQDVYEAAFSQQHANQPQPEQRQCDSPDHQFTNILAAASRFNGSTLHTRSEFYLTVFI
jgi:hypothetical protein